VFDKALPLIPFENQEILSKNSSVSEAAKNLFAAMRRLDSLKLDLIVIEKFPEFGLGPAINDRLNRARG
jgi:L-threonylcarbamoyladenylate synthase